MTDVVQGYWNYHLAIVEGRKVSAGEKFGYGRQHRGVAVVLEPLQQAADTGLIAEDRTGHAVGRGPEQAVTAVKTARRFPDEFAAAHPTKWRTQKNDVLAAAVTQAGGGVEGEALAASRTGRGKKQLPYSGEHPLYHFVPLMILACPARRAFSFLGRGRRQPEAEFLALAAAYREFPTFFPRRCTRPLQLPRNMA